MKTIFSYIAKCLLTYTLSFALLQVQVFLPIENLKNSSGYVMAASDGVSLDENGVATKSGSVKTKDGTGSPLIDVVAMMAFGYFTSKAVMMYKPLPMDVMIATGGGVIYAAGEVYAWNAFKDNKAKQIEYSMKENGDNEEQIELLMEQKKGYDDIAKVAKTKMMIQMAAGTAYLGASLKAFYDAYQLQEKLFGCTCADGAAAAATNIVAYNKIPRMSAVKGPQIYVNDELLKSAFAADTLKVATSCAASTGASPSCALKARCEVSAGVCSIYFTGSKLSTTTGSPLLANPTGSSNSFDKFFNEQLQIKDPKSLLADSKVESLDLDDLNSRYGVSTFIEKNSPFYNYNSKLNIVGATLEDKVKSYINNKERVNYFEGKISSTSIDEYNNLKSTMGDLSTGKNSFNYSTVLETALKNGIDLLVPSVQADSFMSMFGASIGIVVAITKTTSTWVDTYMAELYGRGFIWGAGAALATVSYTQTKKVKETAESNSEKIQEIINKFSMQGQSDIDTISGSQISIPSKIPFSLKGNSALSLGSESTPCIKTSSTSNCSSLASGLTSESTGFASLGGSLGTMAGTLGSTVDDISGSNSIPSSAVDGLVELSSQNNALKKQLDTVQKKINSALKSSGQDPIDFAGENSKALAKIRSSIQKNLGASGSSAQKLLASIGPAAAADDSKTKAKAVATAKPSKLKMTTGSAQKKSTGFMLDLENEGSNDGLMSDEVLANQNAANAINGESQDDIVANKDVSIFKVISVRYLKSGFNKLLEEDK